MRSLIGKRVYVDANAIIFFGECHPVFGDTCREIFRQAAVGNLVLVTSELTVAEVLVVPIRYSRDDLITAYLEALSPRSYLQVLPIDRSMLIASARLRATSSLKTPDAIHLSTAIAGVCNVFLTQVRDLKSHSDNIRVVRISDINLSPGPIR